MKLDGEKLIADLEEELKEFRGIMVKMINNDEPLRLLQNVNRKARALEYVLITIKQGDYTIKDKG